MVSKLSKGQKRQIGSAALCITVAAVIASVVITNENRFTEKLEQAKAVGFPTEGKDISALYKDNVGLNAADVYPDVKLKTMRLAFTDQRRGREMVERMYGCLLSESQWEFVETYLNEYRPILDDFDLGARMDYCYFAKDWSRGFNVTFPELTDMKLIAKHLTARIRLNLRRNDLEPVERDFETLALLSQHIADQPTLIALNVASAVRNITMRAVHASLEEAMRDPEVRRIFREAVKRVPENWNLTNMLHYTTFEQYWHVEHEVAEGRIVISAMSHGDEINVEPEEKLYAKALSTDWAVREIKSSLIDVFADAIRKYRPEMEAKEVFALIAERIEEESARSRVLDIYYSVSTPHLPNATWSLDRNVALRRSLLAALDALAHYDEKCTWPSGLLVQYIDPSDGEPVRYKETSDGFRVWTVGRNGVDNGGVDRYESTNGFDEVVQFPPLLRTYEELTSVGTTTVQPPAGGPRP